MEHESDIFGASGAADEVDDEVIVGEVVDIPLGPGKGRSIQHMERQKKALALRRAGATYEVIAAECGYSSASNAARAIKRALNNELREASNEYFALQLMRSEQLLMVMWGDAMNGDHAAWDRALAAVRHIDGYVGAKGADGSITINMGTGDGDKGVLVIKGDDDGYMAGLRAMANDHGFSFPGDMEDGEEDHED